jgi:thioredoxin reductase (NADPH)
MGKEKRRLGLKDEDKYQGKGVSYCATCDAVLFKDKIVGVVGGGNSALDAASLISKYAKKVYVLHRGKEYTKSDPSLIEAIKKNKKISIMFNTVPKELIADIKLQGVKLNSGKTLILDGLFVEIGADPRSEIAKKIGVKVNQWKEIVVDKHQRTNVKGLFAAGDITNNPLKQIITAAAEGAIAATSVYEEIKKNQ